MEQNNHYHGYDVHAYTPLLQNLVKKLNLSNDPINNDEFQQLLTDLINKYGETISPCINNIKRCYYHDGYIHDSELPDINFALILKDLYKNFDEVLLRETLEEVGSTCLQGLTHRLLVLYLINNN